MATSDAPKYPEVGAKAWASDIRMPEPGIISDTLADSALIEFQKSLTGLCTPYYFGNETLALWHFIGEAEAAIAKARLRLSEIEAEERST